jgi:small subunit ribosomal protein S1
MKQLEENPYDKVLETYPPGAVVEGVIRNIADFGVFVELEPGIDGLVHITDLSWTQRVRHPSELFKKGDKVRAMVLNIDNSGEKPKISLGLKQLAQDPWDRIPYDFPIGKIVEVKILKLTDFGAFAELEPGIEGLIHISEISEERVEDPRTHLEPARRPAPRSSRWTRRSGRSACRSSRRAARTTWPTRRASPTPPRPARPSATCSPGASRTAASADGLR